MREWICFWCGTVVILLMTACGHESTVILAPDRDGSVGRITVTNAAGSVEIDRANQATTIRSQNQAPAPPRELEPEEVDKLFGKVLAHEPQPPVHYLLYFESGSVTLTKESEAKLPRILVTIRERAPTRISVVGHSDTMGNEAYNLDLSMRRARAVQKRLIDHGVDEAELEVTSHGEENPLVETADNVSNAQNRRVEVIVR